METFGLKLNYRPVVMKSKLFSEAESLSDVLISVAAHSDVLSSFWPFCFCSLTLQSCAHASPAPNQPS